MNETGTLIPIDGNLSKSINDTIQDVIMEQDEFKAILVVTLVKKDDGFQAVRIYYSGLNYLERVGILEDAKDLIQHPVE